MINYFYFLFLFGIVVSLIVISFCVSIIIFNIIFNISLGILNLNVFIFFGVIIKIDINDVLDLDLKKLVIKLNVFNLLEKIKESCFYKDINELVIKKVMSFK